MLNARMLIHDLPECIEVGPIRIDKKDADLITSYVLIFYSLIELFDARDYNHP